MSNERFYVVACQLDMPNPTVRDEIGPRVDCMLSMIDYAVTGYEPRGHQLLAHMRTEAYAGYSRSINPPGPAGDPPSIQSNEDRILVGRRSLDES